MPLISKWRAKSKQAKRFPFLCFLADLPVIPEAAALSGQALWEGLCAAGAGRLQLWDTPGTGGFPLCLCNPSGEIRGGGPGAGEPPGLRARSRRQPEGPRGGAGHGRGCSGTAGASPGAAPGALPLPGPAPRPAPRRAGRGRSGCGCPSVPPPCRSLPAPGQRRLGHVRAARTRPLPEPRRCRCCRRSGAFPWMGSVRREAAEGAGPGTKGASSAAGGGCGGCRSSGLGARRGCGQPEVFGAGDSGTCTSHKCLRNSNRLVRNLCPSPRALRPRVRVLLAGESCQRWKGLFTCVCVFSWELRAKAELLFLAERSRENLLLSLLC